MSIPEVGKIIVYSLDLKVEREHPNGSKLIKIVTYDMTYAKLHAVRAISLVST
jgi:hypothetical protein